MLYAAFIGLLLASYVAPIQDIFQARAEAPHLEKKLHSALEATAATRREVAALNTSEGIERAARERYGMVKPSEKVYILPGATPHDPGGR